LNLLFIHSSSDLYGSDKSLFRTIKTLSDNGHVCHVILPKAGPLADKLKCIDCRVIIWEIAIIRRQLIRGWGLLHIVFTWFIAEIKIGLLIKENNIQIVHINTTAVINGQISSFFLRRVVLQHVREITIKPVFLARLLASFNGLLSTEILAVSEAVKSHLSDIAPKYKNKITVIANGIKPQPIGKPTMTRSEFSRRYRFPNNTVVIGCVGRLHYWKGQDYLIESISVLGDIGLDYCLLIAGDVYPGYEYYEEKIKNDIIKYNLSKNVKLLGFIENIPAFLNNIDLLVLPSTLPDPLPGVILEAMAAKLPVIATNHGGATEMVIPEKTGLLISKDDPGNFAAALKRLLKNAKLRTLMGEEGYRHYCNKYTIDIYESNISAIFSAYSV
jgi:glycosyltransferase involved in cell wall biosynthesis